MKLTRFSSFRSFKWHRLWWVQKSCSQKIRYPSVKLQLIIRTPRRRLRVRNKLFLILSSHKRLSFRSQGLSCWVQLLLLPLSTVRPMSSTRENAMRYAPIRSLQFWRPVTRRCYCGKSRQRAHTSAGLMWTVRSLKCLANQCRSPYQMWWKKRTSVMSAKVTEQVFSAVAAHPCVLERTIKDGCPSVLLCRI